MNVSLEWFPLLPAPLVVALTAALLGALAWGTWLLNRKAVGRRQVIVLALLRTAAVTLFAILLLRPVLLLPRQVRLSPDVLVLVDASESMAQTGRNGATRLDEVREILASSPAMRSAEKSHRLHWFAFDGRARPLEGGDLNTLAPSGTQTDFAASLESAMQHVRLANAAAGRDGGPSRVLLASDGLDQGMKNAAETAKQLGLTVDVLAPAAAATGGARAVVSVVDVQAAPRVLLGSETAFEVAVRAETATDPLLLTVQENGREIERREIASIGAGEERRVLVVHRPGEPGLKRYTAQLLRGEEALGRPRSVNVQVTDHKHDVLFLEDTWRWEFKFLKRVFEDDPSFTLTALLSRGGGAYVQFGEPERRVHMAGFPRSRTELDGFETILLGNVNPETWPAGLARNLSQAVSEGGKSLVVLGGPHLARWVNVPELTQLLPVDIARESAEPVSGRIELRLTAEGEATSWFSQERAGVAAAPAPGASQAALPLTPVEHVYPVVRKRPAATVLVETVGKSNEYGPLIVMAEHPFGRGRVLFIATDTLWQWQTLGPRDESGTTLYATFWQQALRAMAPAAPTSSPVRLWLRPERTVSRTGERVTISAELQRHGDAEHNTEAARLTAHVVLPDGRRVPLDLSADPKQPSRHTAMFEPALAGQYRIEATAHADARTLAEAATVLEVQPRAAESDSTEIDVAGLARLASRTGGRVIDPQSDDGWLPPGSAPSVTVSERRSFDLWRNFSLLISLCVLLGADWMTRLIRGLV